MSRRSTLPFDPPPDELVLAAVERASTDAPKWLQRACEGAAFATEVARHLDLPQCGPGSRWLPNALGRLARAGMLAIVTPSNHKAFVLTPDGDSWLHALDSVGELPELPESPRHRRWREAVAAAEEHLPRLREEVRRACGEALRLAEQDPAEVDSDQWHTLARRLNSAADHMEVAVHCLTEWPEPDNETPDRAGFAVAMKRTTWLFVEEVAT